MCKNRNSLRNEPVTSGRELPDPEGNSSTIIDRIQGMGRVLTPMQD